MARFRVNGTSEGPAPYTRGWRAPWRGEWGPLGDGHSRLGRERRRQEQALETRYPGDDALGLRAEAAALRAVAAMLRAQLGVDPRVTVRKITAAQKAAGHAFALFIKTRGLARQPTPAELLARFHAAQATETAERRTRRRGR